MTYPPRTDPMVIQSSDKEQAVLDPPGAFPHFVEAFAANKERQQELGLKMYEPTKQVSQQDRDQLNKLLAQDFGTPANPKVAGIPEEAKQSLQLDDEMLQHGSRLYRRHCLHCHGLSGDGRGPTAPWVNPHPRDYRPGLFKFISTLGSGPGAGGLSRKPSRSDLLRTLQNGVEGTSMPSFKLLPEEELQALASYVIHLSIRGNVEFNVLKDKIESPGDYTTDEAFERWLPGITGWWAAAGKNQIKPQPYTVANDTERLESVKRGYAQFQKTCLSCHTDFGRRNNYLYDSWGTVVRPANLTLGVYRGGRRPLDLYWRVRGGISGANMAETSDDNIIWDIVNFVQAVPYKQMLPDEIRAQVYPEEKQLAAKE